VDSAAGGVEAAGLDAPSVDWMTLDVVSEKTGPVADRSLSSNLSGLKGKSASDREGKSGKLTYSGYEAVGVVGVVATNRDDGGFGVDDEAVDVATEDDAEGDV